MYNDYHLGGCWVGEETKGSSNGFGMEEGKTRQRGSGSKQDAQEHWGEQQIEIDKGIL